MTKHTPHAVSSVPSHVYESTKEIIHWINYLTGVKVDWHWDNDMKWVELIQSGKDKWSIGEYNLHYNSIEEIVFMYIEMRIER